LIAAEVGDLLQAAFAFGAHLKAPGVKKLVDTKNLD